MTTAHRYFTHTGALYQAAADRAGTYAADYQVGGHRIAVHSAGAELLRRTDRALARPAVDAEDGVDTRATEPSLTVEMWDSASSQVPIGRAPWEADACRPLGLVEPYCTERFLAALDVHTASLSLFDRETATARFWLEDADRMAYWQAASPLRLIISWWASTLGMQLTHVAAVAGPRGAVLLVGGAGAGKSTTSLTCVAGGLQFLGDDYCLIDPSPEPTVHRVYATAKLRPDALERLPEFLPLARNARLLDRQKAVLDLMPTFAGSLAESAPIRAIGIPRVAGRFGVRPVSPGAVLKAMAPSTIFGLFGATRDSLANLARLAATVPGYELELGDDVAGVVDTIAELVA